MNIKLYIVVPCYNEEEVIAESVRLLNDKISELIAEKRVSAESRIVVVDDGSTDATWDIITKLEAYRDKLIGIRLSHNQGHQNALLAGLMYAKNKCDCVITIDADLQDDIEAFSDMLEKYSGGCHVVYGVREERTTDSVLKRGTAQLFYRFMALMGAEIVYNHADYRLMSNKAVNALEGYKENNLFLRGIVPLIGFKSEKVYYARKERTAGETKYSVRKMIKLAFDGITSFSVKPLHAISFLGMVCSVFSICGLLYALISYFAGVAVQGWTAIVCSIWLLGGIQLLCLGVLGEYIGRIFSEVKQRPRYHIEEVLDSGNRS